MTQDNKNIHPEIDDSVNICEALQKEFYKSENSTQSPGVQFNMIPSPISYYDTYSPSNKLNGKTVLITGGDSGIGRAIAYHCSAEGANIAFSYLNEHRDAEETYNHIKNTNNCGDVMEPVSSNLTQFQQCQELVNLCHMKYGTIDILINNIATQTVHEDINDINTAELQQVFSTNVYSYIYMSQLVLPYLNEGDSIINTASVVAFRGSWHLVDYAATKGAIVSFTKSLAKNLIKQKIRVNAVAPGPVWTPLISSTFTEDDLKRFGANTIYGEPAQPADIAPCYIFLASSDSKFLTGQVLHPNGGDIFY